MSDILAFQLFLYLYNAAYQTRVPGLLMGPVFTERVTIRSYPGAHAHLREVAELDLHVSNTVATT